MTKNSDGIFKDWGERVDYSPVKGRKGKNIRSGKSADSEPEKPSGPATREKLARTTKRVPEVMVKITGGGKNMKHIEASIEYISRDGEIEIEDENGDLHKGLDGVKDVRDAWARGRIGIPEEGQKRKEAFNIILSMPPGTDRESVKDSARAFAAAQFRNHQYVFASHEDERHPHVHLIVKAVAHDGVRLNPRKADLQLWRVRFAEQLRERGIEANATPRRARGVVKKAEKQAVHNIDLEFEQGKRDSPSLITKARKQTAEQEIKAGKPRSNPIQDKFSVARKGVEKVYGQIARTLSRGDTEDKALAMQIVDFVKQMPPVVTKHQQAVDDLRAAEARKQAVKTNEVEQGRAEPRDERTR